MQETIVRLLRYTVVRTVWLLLAVCIAVFLTVVIANMGGEMDRVRLGNIRMQVTMAVYQNEAYMGLPDSVLRELIDTQVEQETRRLGLDRPFIVRSIGYMGDALSLNLGRAEYMTSDAGSRQVRNVLLERLPSTLVLFGTAELVLFFISLLLALFLSRRYGSFLDRLIVGLAPTSAAPGWFYGIFLILIFATWLRVLPWGGFIDAPPPETTVAYALSVLKHMILPATAIVVGAIFSSIYSWRTFFLIYSSEDYVDLARAKGLPSGLIERRYILRPTLPAIVTGFLMLLITMWSGQIVLETVFRWPGIGQAYFVAVGFGDTPVIVGVTVIFGYLLALTVFLLDFIYAIVDPRIRVGPGTGGSQ